MKQHSNIQNNITIQHNKTKQKCDIQKKLYHKRTT